MDVPFESDLFGVTGLETHSRRSTRAASRPACFQLDIVLSQRMSAGPAEIFGSSANASQSSRPRTPVPLSEPGAKVAGKTRRVQESRSLTRGCSAAAA